MFRRIGLLLTVTVLAAAAAAWWLTAPQPLSAQVVGTFPTGDASRGERVFWAGGCASCHAAPGAEGEDLLRLGGGHELRAEPFGTFVSPNISPHPVDGIGGWDLADFANAMMAGVSPEGRHYYPAFPYASYARMQPQDISDLFAYLGTLDPVAGAAAPHRVNFPYSITRGIGAWKALNMNPQPVTAPQPGESELVALGRYLVEGPGHCGECHTPRDVTGGLRTDLWLAGGPAPEGEGRVPNITPHAKGLGSWSEADITYYLESGFTPEFDSVGGSMVPVQRAMARLTPRDREAIAAYLKSVPAVAPQE